MELPDFRIEANHLLGCINMDEESLREEMIIYLQKACLVGVKITLNDINNGDE